MGIGAGGPSRRAEERGGEGAATARMLLAAASCARGRGDGRIFLVWGEAAPECPRWTNTRGTVTERGRGCRARGEKVDVEAPSGGWRCVLLEIPKCCHFSQQFPGQPRGSRLNVGCASHPTLSLRQCSTDFHALQQEASSLSGVWKQITCPAFRASIGTYIISIGPRSNKVTYLLCASSTFPSRHLAPVDPQLRWPNTANQRQ